MGVRIKQSGVATILIVLLIGLSITAITLGVSHSVKSTQFKQQAVHASTNAQAAAWVGVNVFKQYLSQVEFDKLEQLKTNQDLSLTVSGVTQTIVASIATIDISLKDTKGIYITANISAKDVDADSTSAIQAVYNVVNASCSVCKMVVPEGMDFYDDVSLGGDITFKADAATNTVMNVDGSVDAISIALKNVTYLNATGDISLASGVPIKEVFTNGNLTLSGSANLQKASALGNVVMRDNGRTDVLYTNGNVLLNGGGSTAVNARGNIESLAFGTHNILMAGGTVKFSGTAQKIHAKKNIEIVNWSNTRDVASEGTITCPSPYWGNYDLFQAKVDFVNCPGVSAKLIKGVNLSVPIMDELKPLKLTKPSFDTWPLRNSANYIFEYVSGAMKVTVKNVSGIASGSYFLGKYPTTGTRGYSQFLCDAVNSSGYCTSPATVTKTICNGFSTSNDCFSYDVSKKLWQFNGRNMAPGIVWVDGDLSLANGIYYNTFLVTGNIVTTNVFNGYAPNYAGYNTICNNAFPQYPSTDFAGIYPEQLCNTTNSTLKYSTLSNVALMAGGNNPNNGGIFEGGDITLAASNELFGAIMVGGHLVTGGSTVVHGYIVATANTKTLSKHSLGGSTTIDLTNLPATYKPSELPQYDLSQCSAGACATGSKGAQVLWARYL